MSKITETFAVEGMTCGSCVRHVGLALKGVEGVEVGTVAIGTAEVTYDPQEVTRQEIIDAIKEEGYTVATIVGA